MARIASFFMCTFALMTAAGCVTGGQDNRDPLSLEAKTLPSQVATLNAWDALDKEIRHDLVEGDYKKVAGLTLTAKQKLPTVSAPGQKQLAALMDTFMHKNVDLTVTDTHRGRIGEVATWVEFLLLADQSVAAGRITYDQAGCDLNDDSGRTFATPAAAKAAGCALPGGAWTVYGSFNRDGTPFEYGDFMSWGS